MLLKIGKALEQELGWNGTSCPRAVAVIDSLLARHSPTRQPMTISGGRRAPPVKLFAYAFVALAMVERETLRIRSTSDQLCPCPSMSRILWCFSLFTGRPL